MKLKQQDLLSRIVQVRLANDKLEQEVAERV
jgi:hypothetical protein